jgi:RNA polymerase sigma-70 factor (ECF subfamily)
MGETPSPLFPTTNWQDLAALKDGDGARTTALERLCSTYWFPIYAFIRGQTMEGDRALDLTQGFFEQLLERESLSRVERHGGRFRSYLLTACRNYLSDAHRYESRQLRRPAGGLVDLESVGLDARYASALSAADSPETVFERQWALVTIERAFALVEADYRRRGRGELFTHLHRYLDSDPAALSHQGTAAVLGMSETSVKAELHRLRLRLRDAIQAEVALTVTEPADAENEYSVLVQALAG